eukprot:PITA_13694
MCIHKCIREDEIYDILKACHDEPSGGHFADHRTRHKGCDNRWREEILGHKITTTLQNHHITHRVTSPYHPQANGQVESTNKVIEAILTKIVSTNRRDWVARLLEALWAYRTTWKNTTGYSLYQLVFGKEPNFPIEFEIKALRTTQEVGLDLIEAQTK